MPGMKLDFLKNPSQRVATGKSLPLKQVEAIVLYGKPAQRAKVVQKLLPAVYGLSLNKTTHHILLTLLDQCDNMDRVKLLYHVRRKLSDLALSPVGNSVLQRMLEKLPTRQKKEITEVFVLNVDETEFCRLCQHPFGNHVAQKIMEFPECVEMVLPFFLPHLSSLSLDPYGMRVVAKYVDSVEDGCAQTVETLFPSCATADPAGDEAAVAASNTLDKAVLALFRSAEESLVLTALLRHARAPVEVKDAIVAHLSEFAADYLIPSREGVETAIGKSGDSKDEEAYAMPDFGIHSTPSMPVSLPAAPINVHVYCAALEYGDEAQRTELWASLSARPDLLFAITHIKSAVLVGIAVVRFVEAARTKIYQSLQQATVDETEALLSNVTVSASGAAGVSTPDKKNASKKLRKSGGHKPEDVSARSGWIVDAATDPVRTVLLRAFIEVARDTIAENEVQLLSENAVTLAQNPVSSPVLQKLVEADLSGECAKTVMSVLLRSSSFTSLVTHPAASFLLQSILQYAPEEVRAPLVEALSTYYAAHLHEALSYAQGSRVMQKLLAYAPDATVTQTVQQLISEATQEEEEREAANANGGTEDENAGEENAKVEEKEGEGERELSAKEQRELNRTKHYDVLSHALVSYALHNHACYVVQALLREVRTRQLDRERRLLMNELKPHVFALATSPWAGRIVLDTMMAVGSAQLTEAMKNVAFLRAEEWLSDVSDEKRRRGNGIDPTVRNVLKRQREDMEKGLESKQITAENKESSAPKKKKKIFRTMRK